MDLYALAPVIGSSNRGGALGEDLGKTKGLYLALPGLSKVAHSLSNLVLRVLVCCSDRSYASKDKC